ncbi:hypothetical protein DYB34_010606, partial [Aphanomyces astaci]
MGIFFPRNACDVCVGHRRAQYHHHECGHAQLEREIAPRAKSAGPAHARMGAPRERGRPLRRVAKTSGRPAHRRCRRRSTVQSRLVLQLGARDHGRWRAREAHLFCQDQQPPRQVAAAL